MFSNNSSDINDNNDSRKQLTVESITAEFKVSLKESLQFGACIELFSSLDEQRIKAPSKHITGTNERYLLGQNTTCEFSG